MAQLTADVTVFLGLASKKFAPVTINTAFPPDGQCGKVMIAFTALAGIRNRHLSGLTLGLSRAASRGKFDATLHQNSLHPTAHRFAQPAAGRAKRPTTKETHE